MMTDHPIPPAILAELVRLDHATGRMYLLPRGPEWFKDGDRAGRSALDRAQRWNAKNAGREILGGFDGVYLAGNLLGKRYRAHIVSFALANGRWPTLQVDHEDTDQLNNRPSNLREATQRQNNCNRDPWKQGQIGIMGVRGKVSQYKGVIWDKHIGKWRAYCGADGKREYLGVFPDDLAAARAYDAAAMRLHGEFARLNFPAGRQSC